MHRDARVAIILLMRGILYKKEHEREFFELVHNSFGEISDYFNTIGLEVMVSENDGFAYLKNMAFDEEDEALPKLINSRELSFKVSLLCVILREKLAEFEMQSDNEIAVISAEEIVERLLVFMESEFNEIKVKREIDATVKKVEDLGFLRKIRNHENLYEIKSAIKAFVDAQWLEDFDRKMQAYKEAKQWS